MEGRHEEYGSVPEINTSESDGNGTNYEVLLSDDDPDFSDSGNELDFEGDDFLYERNVTNGIELGSNVSVVENVVRNEVEGDLDVYDLKYPSSEEIQSNGALDDKVGYWFSEFLIEVDIGFQPG
ncbi:Hypothetical predicted protein [Olea europaea subsp. europaea]|uniref:Uncharacterized protein n=1 Tax=Olea europaea subsp. europaea TaxID=158383 RepID=A0A8S0UEK0_OLEEU|nr:Hypothetical predicted protein [Olea europaea subsp. europaea]